MAAAVLVALVALAAHAGIDASAAFEESVALYGMGKLDEALAHLDLAAEATSDPQLLAKVHRQRAFIFEQRGDRGRAVAAFMDALRLDPKISVDPRQHDKDVVALFECAKKKDTDGASIEAVRRAGRSFTCAIEPAIAQRSADQTSSLAVGTATQAAPRTSIRGWAWAPAIAGVAFGGAGVFFLARASSSHSALTGAASPDPFVSADELRSRGERDQTAGQICFAAATSALITAALMYALGGDE